MTVLDRINRGEFVPTFELRQVMPPRPPIAGEVRYLAEHMWDIPTRIVWSGTEWSISRGLRGDEIIMKDIEEELAEALYGGFGHRNHPFAQRVAHIIRKMIRTALK